MSRQQDEKIASLSTVNTRLESELAKALRSNEAMAKDRLRILSKLDAAEQDADDLRLKNLKKAISDSQAPGGLEVGELRDQVMELHRELGEVEAERDELRDQVSELRMELASATVTRAILEQASAVAP